MIDKDHYDPNQDKEERRKIRFDYRKLIKTAEGNIERNRREFATIGSDGLDKTVDEANALFAKVRNPSEATLDSKLLVISADITTQKARNLRVNHNLFNVEEFLAKVRGFCRPNTSGTDWQWSKLGKRAAKYSRHVHATEFMLGPLHLEKKTRKVTKHVRITRNKEDLVRPQQLEQGDIQQQNNETSAAVNAIYKILDDRGPINYFEFITNHESFSQTVENMFYVSFLVRNGVAEIDDQSGQPILQTRAHPTIEELNAGLAKHQIIMSLSQPQWQKIIKTYGIRSSIIPTREQQQTQVGQTKWY
ncbi:Nse4 C-terminal-domain-containing protein [Gongronella butleri]|nr:Nse4 C-terminal-domain-containing protein [Gongronella butleri]